MKGPGRIKDLHVNATTSQSIANRDLVSGATYDRELRDLLSGIGAPRAAAFKPDPFQLEALAALECEDVLVTAPTGQRQDLDCQRRDSAPARSRKARLVHDATKGTDQFQVRGVQRRIRIGSTSGY